MFKRYCRPVEGGDEAQLLLVMVGIGSKRSACLKRARKLAQLSRLIADDLVGEAGGQPLIGETVWIAAYPLVAHIGTPFCGGEALMD